MLHYVLGRILIVIYDLQILESLMQMNGFPDSLEVPKHSAEGMTQNTGKALGQYQEQFLPAKKTPWPCSATVRMSHEFYILFFLSRSGLSNEGIPEDSTLISARRSGRRGRRQKDSKLIDGKYQSASAERENSEVGEPRALDASPGELRLFT